MDTSKFIEMFTDQLRELDQYDTSHGFRFQIGYLYGLAFMAFKTCLITEETYNNCVYLIERAEDREPKDGQPR